MSTTTFFAPVAAETGEDVKLAMQRLWLGGAVLPAGARLTVQHIFRSEEEKPLEIVYCFPLPRDAALRRFRILGEDFEAHSELKETEDALKAYEEGISQGSLAALARQYGDGLINLNVGNIRPGETVSVYLEILAGVELRDDGFRFRFPFTLAPAYHSRAKAALAAPGQGELELPSDEFGDVILPRFSQDAGALHQVGFDLSVTSALEINELGSPSHAIRLTREDGLTSRVSLAAERDVPDRDLVVDVRFNKAAPQVLGGRGRDGKGHFAAIVPSISFGAGSESPRRIAILLDRSGSMSGAPIEQAKRAIEACLAVLSEKDAFALVAFDNATEVFQPRLSPATRENRDKASQFLNTVNARGGTELAQGFQKAVEVLNHAGGDIFILTDGQVAGTEQILAQARAARTRLHCLGIGSASQDRFLALLARETGGVSRFVTPRERVDLAAVDLFASIGRPVVSGLRANGKIQPAPPATVFAGTPVLLFGEDEESIDLTWDGGGLSLPISLDGAETAETIRLLEGSRLITDWESRCPAGEALAPLEKRKQSRVVQRLRELSRTFGLASREMSLVAVVKRPGDRPGELPETRIVPLGMPQDTAFAAYFRSDVNAGISPRGPLCFDQRVPFRVEAESPSSIADGSDLESSLFRSITTRIAPPLLPASGSPNPAPFRDDDLLMLTLSLEPDGGMPGDTPEDRAATSIAALLAFLQHGHTSSSGAFREHVARIIAFVESLTGLRPDRQKLVAAALAFAREGKAPAEDWLTTAASGAEPWARIEKAIRRQLPPP